MTEGLSSRYIPEVDKVYKDNYFKTIVSFSHLVGSMTGILVDYITSVFGDKYLKGIWNSLEEPYIQRSASFKDFMNKPRPLLLVDPKFDPSTDSEWRPLSEFDTTIANDPNSDIKYGLRDAQRFIDKSNFQMYFRPRRFTINYGVSFIFDSDIQRIQAEQYIRQSIRHRAPIVLHRYIENYIPTEYIKAVAEMNGLKIGSKELEDFLNKDSIYPIKYRFRTGSGANEYFVSVFTPIQVMFTDAPQSDGPMKRGNIVVQSSFSENVTIDFVAPSVYFLRTRSDIGKNMDLSDLEKPLEFEVDKANPVAVDKFIDSLIPIGAESVGDFTRFKQINIQADKNGDDTLDLKEFIDDPEVYSMIDYYHKNNQPIDFVNIIIYEDIYNLDRSRAVFNKSTLELTIKNMNIYKEYYIVIYVDRIKLNNIKDSLFKTEGKEIK